MRLFLSVLSLPFLINIALADQDSELQEKIVSSIENNYKKVSCFSIKFKIDSFQMPLTDEEKRNGGLRRSELATFVANGSNTKLISKSIEGLFLHSVTVNDGISYQYVAPGEGEKNGTVWKRSLKQMPGMGGGPSTWGLDPNEGDFPQFIRARKIVDVRKPGMPSEKNSIYDVILEDAHGNRSLISFDSSMNFLPVRFTNMFGKDSFSGVRRWAYEEKKPGFWFPISWHYKSSFEKYKKIEDLDGESAKIFSSGGYSVTEFTFNGCDETSAEVSAISFPAGTSMRDAITNAIYTIGEEKFEKPQGALKPSSMILWSLLGVCVCALVFYAINGSLSKKKL